MITLDGNHFIYNDEYSSKFGLIFARVETSPVRSLMGKKTGKFVFNKATKSRYLVGDDYSQSSMSFDVEVVTCDGHAIDLQTLREIERWLFSDSTFKKLYVDPADDPYGESYELVYGVQKHLYFNCRFLYPEKLEYNGGIVGFKCTMETDGIMLWQDTVRCAYDMSTPVYVEIEGKQVRVLKGDVDFDGDVSLKDAVSILQEYTNVELMHLPPSFTEMERIAADYNENGKVDNVDALITLQVYSADLLQVAKKKEYIIIDSETHQPVSTVDELTSLLDINVDSDIDGYTYPIIKIVMGATGGELKITNMSDDIDRVTQFKYLNGYAVVEIDCTRHTVSGSMYNKMTSKIFPRLVSGNNNLEVYGDILSFEISWNNRRFM